MPRFVNLFLMPCRYADHRRIDSTRRGSRANRNCQRIWSESPQQPQFAIDTNGMIHVVYGVEIELATTDRETVERHSQLPATCPSSTQCRWECGAGRVSPQGFGNCVAAIGQISRECC